MLKVMLKNGLTFEYIGAEMMDEYYNGIARRTMSIICPADAISVDKLNSELIENNLVSIDLVDEENETVDTYEGYVIKLECGIKYKLIVEETPDYPAVYADRLVIKLGRRTYMEDMLNKLGM